MLGSVDCVEACAGPGQAQRRTAANFGKHSHQQRRQLYLRGNPDQREPGPTGYVDRGNRRAPALVPEGSHCCNTGERCPAQRHVKAIVGGRLRGDPPEYDQAARAEALEIGESLGQPNVGDLAITSDAVDPGQVGERRGGEDRVYAGHAQQC